MLPTFQPLSSAGQVWRTATPAIGGRAARRARVGLDQLTTAWSTAGTLPVTAVDVGLGWPAPTPHPPTTSDSSDGTGGSGNSRGGGDGDGVQVRWGG